jgi:hypothetical protein
MRVPGGGGGFGGGGGASGKVSKETPQKWQRECQANFLSFSPQAGQGCPCSTLAIVILVSFRVVGLLPQGGIEFYTGAKGEPIQESLAARRLRRGQ